MKKIILKIDDNIYEKIIFLLKKLKIEGFEIEEESTKSNKTIDFSLYKIPSLKKIKDPVKWQRTIREEW